MSDRLTYAELEAMYQGQCQTTDEWAAKYREEVERKADATLLARCEELQRAAEVANALVGKERDTSEALRTQLSAARVDAERLDYLDRILGLGFAAGIVELCNWRHANGGDFRSAIDHAMGRQAAHSLYAGE